MFLGFLLLHGVIRFWNKWGMKWKKKKKKKEEKYKKLWKKREKKKKKYFFISRNF